MRFIESIERARAALQRNRRLSFRVLKREFDLDDDALEELIEELVDVQQVAAREGKILAWLGATAAERDEAAAEATPLIETAVLETLTPAAAERRQLTVMFCDLVGSADLSQRLDAEDLRTVMRAYHESASSAIERWGGHVAQYLGDGLLVYFGYPQAHEDDAERAVRAGRDILREIEELNPRLETEHAVRISVRIGIHTGPVVVGEIGAGEKRETLALGETPTIASRLQSVAAPNSVVISETSLRLVAGLFVTEDLGKPALKGFAERIRVHRVNQPSGVSSRLDRAPVLTPFIGREHEMRSLLDRFERVQEQYGQAVWIAGEAGIGKSRLVLQLRQQLRDTPHTWLECRTSPYTQQSAFHSIIELVEHMLRFGDHDSAEQKLEMLERGLAAVGMQPAETVPLFASLLSLRLPQHYAPLAISPQRQRQKTLEALLTWVLALGKQQPVVLLVEDLHWADPSTLEWLSLLIQQCATAKVLALLTFRPNFAPAWPTREHVLPIVLSRLTHRQTKEMVAGAVSEASLSEAMLDAVAARSDGVPLFAEELVKNVVESDRDSSSLRSEVPIPGTLRDSLMARLDGLGEAKQVAQLGAALGREFSYSLLEDVTPLKEGMLRQRLGRLVESELLYQRGLPPDATYTFKHALVQDAAYQSLLRSQRKEIHGRIADALVECFAERVSRHPEVAAHHFAEAGRTDDAITHYQRAGERATKRSAHAEAIAHLRRAIGLLGTLPESLERNRIELQLQLDLGSPLQAAQGFVSSEVEETYERALSLSRGLGETPERFRALAGLATFYRNHDVKRALELGEEVLAHAKRMGEPSQLLFAHSTLGVAMHYSGDLSSALAHEESAISLYDPIDHRSLEFVYGLDPGVSSLCLAAFTLWQLGHPDRALKRVEEGIELAREQSELHSLAYALNWGSVVCYGRGEPLRVLEWAEEAIEISKERGLSQQLGGANIFRVWGLSLSADAKHQSRAVDALQQASAISDKGMASPVSAPFISALVDAHWNLQRLEDALVTVDSGLVRLAEMHAPYWNPELQRLKGEILLARDPTAKELPEHLLLRAIEIAKNQEAKSLELRAATSLARLWQRQHRKNEARALLHPIYDWFTEGFDTQNLKDAEALLEELT